MTSDTFWRAGAVPPVLIRATPLTWWDCYVDSLRTSGMTDTAIRAVDLDSEYLVDLGILGAGDHLAPLSNWPRTRLRRGLAMGSVQSGKTASLLGVVAKSLDKRINVVVILGGTRLALWKQTYERVVAQLDGWTVDNALDKRTQRVLLPSPEVMASLDQTVPLGDLYFETPNLARRLLLEGRPLIAVVMKNEDHLMRFARYLHDLLDSTLQRSPTALHLLVIDDEADDGSILDTEVETDLAPDAVGLKQIPRHIARLWARSGAAHQTFDHRLFATYLAYTATPQANFLQSAHNPLSPSDFVAALRVPGDTGSLLPPRSTTFTEPEGLQRFYTGGELFYNRIVDPSGALCVTRPFPPRLDGQAPESLESDVRAVSSALLSDALRAYFVAGAVGLLQSGRRLSTARSASADSLDAIRLLTPRPHSMLYHPSSRIGDQFAAAYDVAAWSRSGPGVTQSPPVSAGGELTLCVEGLRARLAREEDLWKSWLQSYEHTRALLAFLPGGHLFTRVDHLQWADVKDILSNEVFPHTKLVIVNSDPRADDRPHFAPQRVEGGFLPPRDIFSIFVSGNVMARGITLEGLSTTLFLRSATEPIADSQMQMQRWFGYRGRHLSHCRVFMFQDQLDLFRAYHEGDEAIRREILNEMNCAPEVAPAPLVLQGLGFRATGKIANLRALPLCPGPDPFVRLVEFGDFASANSAVLAGLLERDTWHDVIASDSVKGCMMQRRMSLLDVAEVVESFRYTHHAPNEFAAHHDRWRSLARELGLGAPETPLFRPPTPANRTQDLVSPPGCPYSIAAYLRLWSAVLNRRARGLYPTDDRRTPWSMIDLSSYAKSAPTFYVGIRYGGGGLCQDDRLALRGVRVMQRTVADGLLVSAWGSRNPGESDDAYLGDQLFDYHVHRASPPLQPPGEPLWRPRGSPGLLLFHVIQGPQGMPDAVTFGLALPAGGPDHIAALRSVPGA